MPTNDYHSKAEWRAQLHLIARFYLEDRLSYQEIAQKLAESGFHTSPSSVKARLQQWRVSKSQNDIELMARCFLHYQQQHGKSVTFQKFGVDVPSTTIKEFIERNPFLWASQDPLPEYISTTFLDSTSDKRDATEDNNDSSHQILPNEIQNHASRSLQSSLMGHHRNKKRKLSLPEIEVEDLEYNDNLSETDGGAYHSTTKEIDETDHDDHNGDRSTPKNMVVEIKKALSSLQELLPKTEECVEALESAKELLVRALRTTTDNTLAKALEDSGAFAERITDQGPLFFAAYRNDTQTAAYLLAAGADINARSLWSFTALHFAVMQGCYPFVEFLLQQSDIDIDAVEARGATALHLALDGLDCDCNHRFVHLLLQHGANVNICDCKGRTALYYACLEPGLNTVMKMIIEKTKNINQKDKSGYTPLFAALVSGNDEYVGPLLEAGADLNIPSHRGWTPFMWACSSSIETLLYLLNRDVDLTMKGWRDETALHILFEGGRFHILQHILENYAIDLNAQTREGLTPMMVAAAGGHEEIVRILVAKRAKLEKRTINANTALCIAIANGFTNIAEFLIKSGSPVNPLGQSINKWKTNFEMEYTRKEELSAPNSNKPHELQRQPWALQSGMAFALPSDGTNLD